MFVYQSVAENELHTKNFQKLFWTGEMVYTSSWGCMFVCWVPLLDPDFIFVQAGNLFHMALGPHKYVKIVKQIKTFCPMRLHPVASNC